MAFDALYPLILEPHLHQCIWGGHRLAREFSKGRILDATIGESWEIHEGNRVSNGPFFGRTLEELSDQFPDALLGTNGVRLARGRFPLTIKLVDAALDLSIQVHPNNEQACRLEGEPIGKTEAWCVLSASSGASLVYGLSRKAAREELRERAEDGTIEEILHRVTVRPDDVFLITANTIHSIGGGILLYEVQQPSNTTYRLYDWKRKNADGTARELHLDKAIEVASLTPPLHGTRKPKTIRSGDRALHEELVSCPYFILERVTSSDRWGRKLTGRSFEAVTVADGAIELETHENGYGANLLKACQSVLIPAALAGYTFVPKGQEAKVLIARAPEQLTKC